MYAIELSNLTKVYRKTRRRLFRSVGATALTAVDRISLRIAPGEFIGLLGPNGAGKSTTIKMMTGILHPTSGSVLVHGLNPHRRRVEVARHIGAVFGQRTQLWWDLPLRDSFAILQAMYRVPPHDYRLRLDELEAALQLSSFWETPVRQLSLGQRMRGELVGALLHRPPVLFLDEPTIGLDVTAKMSVRAFLAALNKTHGTTVILTTHDMSDVEQLCPRIVVIDHGQTIFDGGAGNLAMRVGLPSMLVASYRERSGTMREGDWTVDDAGHTVKVSFDRGRTSPVEVLSSLQEIGSLEDFSMTEPGLDAVITRLYAGDART